MCTKLDSRRSAGWFAGFGLAAVKPIQVWGGGFKSLAGGPSACCCLVTVPRSGSIGYFVGCLHLLMPRGSGDNMTCPHLLSCAAAGRSGGSVERMPACLCPVERSAYSVHTYFRDQVIELVPSLTVLITAQAVHLINSNDPQFPDPSIICEPSQRTCGNSGWSFSATYWVCRFQKLTAQLRLNSAVCADGL